MLSVLIMTQKATTMSLLSSSILTFDTFKMSLLITKLKGLFLIILSVFRRALCCFRKRRRNSHCESEILTTIGIVPAYSNTTETKIVRLYYFIINIRIIIIYRSNISI